MKIKIENALGRLNSILPLKARQDACSPEIRELHKLCLRSFVNIGRIPTLVEMAGEVDDLDNAISQLVAADMLVLSDKGEPIGAYPFTMEKREHRVRVNGFDVHAMCALDALAISPMFDMPTVIFSRCRVTGEEISVRQSGRLVEHSDPDDNVQFGIIWNAAKSTTSCADSLCMDMIFLRDAVIGKAWLEQDKENRECFDLQDAIEFAAGFFVPLL